MSRILVAEDDPTLRAMIVEKATSLGYEVVEAANGQEALTKAESSPPDVFLLDIEMPVLDGYSAVKQLRKNGRFNATPIIALTGLADSQEEEKALEAGFDAFVSKPALFSQLKTLLQELLTKS
jgi:two-component system, cell cycle response regulator DivK